MQSKKDSVTNEKIFGLLLDMDERITSMDERIASMDERITSMDERIISIDGHVNSIDERMATKADLREYATKNDLERFRDEILKEVRPLHRAVDTDAETIIDHGRRITALEKHAGIAPR